MNRGAPNRTVVLVSPYFPPSKLAGVHRARHLAKHLPDAGWRPIVLCVDERHHAQTLDLELATLVPAETEIIKVGAPLARAARKLGVGDIGLRAWWPLRAALVRLLRSRHIDAVLITGSPYYPMLLSALVKRRYGVPVVLDFQDPWVSAWGAAQPFWSKAGLTHFLATLLEPRVLRVADHITSVSEAQNAEMSRRYRWLDARVMSAIPIGGDPADFKGLRENAARGLAKPGDPALVTINYVGAFWPRATQPMRAVVKAVAHLRQTAPEIARQLRIAFIGTGSERESATAPSIRHFAREFGVSDLVSERPDRVPYLDALRLLANSDALLLIGSDEPHYTASKIYPALLSGRPYLSLFHRASSAHAILSAAGGGRAFAFETRDDLDALIPALAEALAGLARDRAAIEPARLDVIAPYTAAAVARRFALVFDNVTGSKTSEQCPW